jgi:beta-lactamase regulating signal transducer with metallopeptidase domain
MDKLLHYSQFEWLFRASWHAGVMIVLVLALQWAFGRRLSPRWRYAMWLLVVLRLALPWTIPSPVSVFNLVNFPRHATPVIQDVEVVEAQDSSVSESGTVTSEISESTGLVGRGFDMSLLLWIWAAGAVSLAGYLSYNQYRMSRKVTYRRPLIDARVMNLLEDCKQLMGVRVPVTLVETGDGGSPALFGFLRPRLLLPVGLKHSFSEEELRHVFLHELSHVKRKDILVGWVMTALQILHWFNPLVWVAFHRMRVERELACDAMALSYAKETRPYGETIIKLLEGFGCSAWGPSLVGTLEDRNQLKERIRMIANFTKTNRWPAPAITILAALGVVALTDAQTAKTATSSDAAPAAPKIVSTLPAAGATEVDPGTSEIIVTFDQDMRKGFSWTGGGPDFPPGLKGKKAYWRDSRTCVLPVKLETRHYYRVGINSTSYNNFRGTNGAAAMPSAIYFATKGAPPEVKTRTMAPQVVSFSPSNGEQNVAPDLTEVRVTFNVPMGGGCSWCTVGDDDSDFPKGREGKQYYWTDDKRTCVLPVTLESGKAYRISVNAAEYKNFQSEAGVPCEPVEYSFKTR